MNLYQTTLAKAVHLEGHGLHSGLKATIRIEPAPAGEGITFRRRDRGARTVKASAENVTATELSTCLGQGSDSIATVEHVLSALYGLAVDNARVICSGPEVPILDGSSQPFVEGILDAGLVKLNAGRRYYVVKREFQMRDGERFIKVEPHHRFAVKYGIDFETSVIGRQTIEFTHSMSEYRKVALARTFCHRKDVEAMWQAGLARGGSLANAVVVDDEKVLNEEGLRSNDEFVRHKLLDLIGDFALLQAPLVGKVTVEKGGHALHTRFVRELMQYRKDLLAVVEPATSFAGEEEAAAANFEGMVAARV